MKSVNKENDSTVQVEELKNLSTGNSLPIVKRSDAILETYDTVENGEATEAVLKKEFDLVKQTGNPKNEWIEIKVWRGKNVQINKSLIPLRSALFFWFASGNLCSPFFSLMLVNRGLVLSDFSSIFSIIFLLQLLVSYICGIVADKIGNAKPVLLFLMLSTVFVVVGLLLSPSVKNSSCAKYNISQTCLDAFNCTSDLQYCKPICLTNKTYKFTVDDNNNSRKCSVNSTEGINVPSSSLELKTAFNGTTRFCNFICSCLEISENSCIHKTGFNILYSALILSFFPIWSTTYRFLDFTALNAAKRHNSNFGRERFYGNLGITVVTLLCNFVLSIDKSRTKSTYDNVYWISVSLFIFSIISACSIRTVKLPPGINLSKKTLKLFTDIKIVSVFLVAFAAGVGFTFNIFFHLLFLDSLRASNTVMNLHIVTTSIYGLPMYLTSTFWLKKFGKKKILIFGLLCYVINGTSYSFLYYPWLSLIIEITNAFSFHLFWIAIVVLSHEVAPDGLAATVNAVVGAIHFGIGRSFSVSVGGYLFSNFGARVAYRILAVFCFVTATLYSVFLWLMQIFSERTNEKPSKEEMKSINENQV